MEKGELLREGIVDVSEVREIRGITVNENVKEEKK